MSTKLGCPLHYALSKSSRVTSSSTYACVYYNYEVLLYYMKLQTFIFHKSLDGRCVSLGNILQFFSGANKLPATGFDESPKIAFTSENRLPSTSTCALKITFPRSLGLLTYTEFEEKMDFCIRDSFGFGSA